MSKFVIILLILAALGFNYRQNITNYAQNLLNITKSDKNTVRIECITALKQLCDENIDQCILDCCTFYDKDPKTCTLTIEEMEKWIDSMIEECISETLSP